MNNKEMIKYYLVFLIQFLPCFHNLSNLLANLLLKVKKLEDGREEERDGMSHSIRNRDEIRFFINAYSIWILKIIRGRGRRRKGWLI